MILLLLAAACSDYTVQGEKDPVAPFDSGTTPVVPVDTSDTVTTTPPLDSDSAGRVETAEPGPCSWERWEDDAACTGGWGGTARDGTVRLDGAFAPFQTTLTTDAGAATSLAVADTSGLAVDDEVLVHTPDGTALFVRVLSTGGTTLRVGTPVTAAAGSVVQRVPHYQDVTVGTLTGSRVVFRVCGAVTVEGAIDATGAGWPGGRRATGIPEVGWQGAGSGGAGGQSDAANGTGGGGGAASCNVHADGGGGGHATAGGAGQNDAGYPCVGPGGTGGGTIGDPTLATLHFGGGGGSGYLDNDASAGSWSGAGGAGGGIVYLVARGGLLGAGVIRADGAPGEDGNWIGAASPGGGGGGAGGSIRLIGDTAVALSALGATGGTGSEAGAGPTRGGFGGAGRIRVDGRLDGTASPAALEGCP